MPCDPLPRVGLHGIPYGFCAHMEHCTLRKGPLNCWLHLLLFCVQVSPTFWPPRMQWARSNSLSLFLSLHLSFHQTSLKSQYIVCKHYSMAASKQMHPDCYRSIGLLLTAYIKYKGQLLWQQCKRPNYLNL